MYRYATKRNVKQLQSEAATSRTRIAELFDSRRRKSGAAPAWGQYLDDPLSVQTGLFGTCAGIEVLATQGSNHAITAQRASDQLPDLRLDTKPRDDATLHDLILAKGDLGVTFKVCARAETIAPIGGRCQADEPLFEALIAGRWPTEGWSDYRVQSPLATEWSPTPTIAATASAIYALRRYEAFLASSGHTESLEWLRLNLTRPQSAPMYELALTLLALKGSDHRQSETKGLRRSLEKEICRRLRRTTAEELTPESHEYAAPITAPAVPATMDKQPHDTDPEAAAPTVPVQISYRYMFYLPSVIGAFALLAGGGRLPVRARSGVIRIVALCTARLMAGHGVVAQGRRWLSSVDHLWIYRLLGAYEDAKPQHVSLARPRNVVAGMAAFLALAGAATLAQGWRGFVASLAAELTVILGVYVVDRIR